MANSSRPRRSRRAGRPPELHDSERRRPASRRAFSSFGWTVGAGAEFAVTEEISLRDDYRYYSFGEQVAAFTGYDVGFTPSFHTVSVGLSKAF